MGYSGAPGTLIYEKNLKAKISCQTPFKLTTVAEKPTNCKQPFKSYHENKDFGPYQNALLSEPFWPVFLNNNYI